jgi:UDP:flavonoid glycosyltransferase YjiC (YdhE family)
MPRLKICLAAPPFSGHLNPLLGLGRALSEIADVTVVSTPGMAASGAAAGLAFRPILGHHEALIRRIASPGVEVKSNPLLMFRQLKANVSLQEEMLAAFEEVFSNQQPDLVIADFTLPVAGVAAARHGAAWWTTTAAICVHETPDGPPAYFGGLAPARSPFGNLAHLALRKLTRLFKRGMFLIFRSDFRKAGILSVYRQDGTERIYSPEAVLALSIPEIEFPRTYPPYFRFIGPSLYTPPSAASSPDFIEGKRHILITLGSHLEHHKDRIAAVMRGVAGRHPEWIFHFTDGGTRSAEIEREGNFHRYPFISYDGNIPRYDAVIHHGGTGVMLCCLRHGVPSVVLPQDYDQFDNAARLDHHGVSRRVRRPEEIEAAIVEVMGSEKIRQRCREFAENLGGYDAGGTVCGMVLERFGNIPPSHE